MPRKTLTANFVQTIKAPKGARIDYWDTKVRGLSLRVSTDGQGTTSKTWTLLYRVGGRQRRFKLGSYPVLKLAEARDQATIRQGEIARGENPSALRDEERRQVTVREMSVDYLKVISDGGKRSWKKDRGMLDKDILPVIGGLRPTDVTGDDIRKIARRVIGRGMKTQANRVHEVVRGMFNWAVNEKRMAVSPCYGVKWRVGGKYQSKPVRETARERILKRAEILAIWKRIEKGTTDKKGTDLKITEPVQIALKLLLVLGQRVSEISQAPQSEIDLDQRLWTIPGSRTKNGRAHRIPLPDMAVSLVKRAVKLSGDSKWLFPTPYGTQGNEAGNKPIGPTSLNHALRRVLTGSKIKDLRPHDFRRTVATELADMGTREDHIAAVLNHVRSGVTQKHYIQHKYENEKRIALEAWARRLADIIAGRKIKDNVVPFRDTA